MSVTTEAVAAAAEAPAAAESAPSAPVEAPEAPSEAPEAAEPAESTPVEAAGTPEPTKSAPAEAPSTPEPATEADWAGELAALQGAEWFKGLSPDTQTAVLKGIETKYKNWQSGYTQKFQNLATQREKLQADKQKLRQEQIRVQKWLYGSENPLADKQAELDGLTQSHAAALEEMKKAHAEAIEAAQSSHKAEFEAAKKSLTEAQEKVQQFETAKAERDKVELEAAASEFMSYVKNNAPDIMENDAMYFDLVGACQVGNSLDDAILMVRAKYGKNKPQPESVPDAVDMMNMGSGQAAGTESGNTRSFSEMMDEMRREAQRSSYASGE